MSQKRPPLFKLDLRVDKKMIKLKVHEEDFLSDLIQRLQASISWKEIASDKVRLRLEQQFRKIMEQQTLSTQVKDKLNELLEESKVVIVGIDTGSNNNTFNETPFKILQESLVNLSKDRKSAKSHYHYLDQPSLHINYESAETR